MVELGIEHLPVHVDSFVTFFPREKFLYNNEEIQYGDLLITIGHIDVLHCAQWNGNYFTLETSIFDFDEEKKIFLGRLSENIHQRYCHCTVLSLNSSKKTMKTFLIASVKFFSKEIKSGSSLFLRSLFFFSSKKSKKKNSS